MLKEYMTISSISGPLVVVDKITDVTYAELVEVQFANGQIRRGKVLEISRDKALVQMFEGTIGLDVRDARVRFLGFVMNRVDLNNLEYGNYREYGYHYYHKYV